ncbi:MAG: threonine--tRNA ligase [Chloroflexi bacterium]|nr:threonine--tRNA ligase [Chloroflexota bacterium]
MVEETNLERVRHSAAHVMAQAVQSLFGKNVKLGIGPAIEDGFYYDFDLPRGLTLQDLGQIEQKMAEIVAANLPFIREELDRAKARDFFQQLGQEYKVELIDEIPDDKVSVYTQGDFVDLCRGPHVISTGKIGPFKLLSTAGAYWRGDEKRPMLQRIYGTAFATQEELQAHLNKLEEAARRDHRRLGRELDLFSVSEDVGPGLILWHPKGAIIRQTIENFWRAEHIERGYVPVTTPHVGKLDLWKTSGHWDWYRENMFPPMEIEGQEYLLKPMNCPFHITIYNSDLRSYRDLPLRWAELGTVYRYERSGVLHGMLRVRGFTQDDAHIFCRADQLESEIVGVIDLCQFMMATFGYEEFDVELSVRDPANKDKYIGADEVWDQAEAALMRALDLKGVAYRPMEGEAKFYGPAIDIKVHDALGRAWQGPTIQVDFNLPERFGMEFVGTDGFRHRPVMVHRAIFGSLERFVGGLVEHYAGAFPVWLAPVQAVVIPIADRHLPYAETVAERARQAGMRVDVDGRREKVNYKIREAQLQKVPYMLVVGDQEVGSDTVSVRLRTGENLGPLGISTFVDKALQAVQSRSLVLS